MTVGDATTPATRSVVASPVDLRCIHRVAASRGRVGLRSGRVATLIFVNRARTRARVQINNYAFRVPVDEIEYVLTEETP